MKKRIERKLQKHAGELKGKYQISAIYLFGSALEKSNRSTSPNDVDLLIEFLVTPTLFQFVCLKRELEQILDSPVDLVTREALHPWMKESIESSMKRVA